MAQSAPHGLRIHSIVKNSRFLPRGAWRVTLDKVGGDMVHPRCSLRPLKENGASGTIISNL
jgi:hypothetical protein